MSTFQVISVKCTDPTEKAAFIEQKVLGIIVEGLAITPVWDSEEQVFSKDEWTITHVNSGYCVYGKEGGFSLQENAMICVMALNRIYDWQELEVPLSVDMKGLAEQTRDIIGDRLDAERFEEVLSLNLDS
jgi:hypothetical protein